MHILVNQELLLEVRVHLENFVDCLVRNQNKDAFHMRPPWRREAALEHTDVCYVDAASH